MAFAGGTRGAERFGPFPAIRAANRVRSLTGHERDRRREDEGKRAAARAPGCGGHGGPRVIDHSPRIGGNTEPRLNDIIWLWLSVSVSVRFTDSHFQERPLGARASCPLQHTGGLSEHLWALRPTCGRDARGPRNSVPHGRLPWERGHPARFNTPVGLRNTGGPSAHLRARRPRSQEQRSAWALALGARASCPLQHTGGLSEHRWAFGPLAGETPALPGTPFRMGAFPGTVGILPASTHRWDCGPRRAGRPEFRRTLDAGGVSIILIGHE